MKKEFYKVIIAIGFIVFAAGLLVDTMIAEAVSLEIISAYSLIAAFGFVFVFAGNATLNKLGYIFSAFAGIYGIANVMFSFSDALIADFGAIVMLAGSIIRLIITILEFLGYTKGGKVKSGEQNDIYEELVNYNKLLAEQVIDEQEYTTLKAQLFGERHAKGACGNVDELKKWRKLADQKIISDSEYSAMKAKILKIK